MVEGVTISVMNPKLYHLIVTELRNRGYKLVHDGKFVITDGNDEGKERTLLVRDEKEVHKIVGEISALTRGKEEFNELLIGVDTNPPNLTVAVVADGELIDYYVRVKKDDLCDLFSRIISMYPHRRYIIGIGIGNLFGYDVLRLTKERFPDVRKVNEYRSSSRTHLIQVKDSDVRAAFVIAIRAAKENSRQKDETPY